MLMQLSNILQRVRGKPIKRIPVSVAAGTPVHALAIATVVRDEAACLAEWIDFHLAQGVSHFYIFDNDSSDSTLQILAPYCCSELVSVIPWKHRKGYHTQARAYAHALSEFGPNCQWMIFIDVDEFLYCPTGRKISQFLAEFTDYPALIVHRHTFGTSGHERPPPAVTGHFHLRVPAPEGPFEMWGNLAPKSVVQPSRVLATNGAHLFKLRGTAAHGHDETGEPVFGRIAPAFRDRLIRIDHFFTKDRQTYERRISRGKTVANAVHPASDWHNKLKTVESRATVHDRQILRALPPDWPARQEAPA